MEKSKYYTPSIEEFHIGFECEAYYLCGSPKDIGQYSKYKLTWTDWCYIVNDSDWVVRVKYLDKEDIESLGFKLSNRRTFTKTPYKRYEKDGYCIDYFWENPVVPTFMSIKLKEGDNILFSGKIKNLSELKRLFKQLGIDG